jgi:hypothetical protein
MNVEISRSAVAEFMDPLRELNPALKWGWSWVKEKYDS